jgi:hypothetical protein
MSNGTALAPAATLSEHPRVKTKSPSHTDGLPFTRTRKRAWLCRQPDRAAADPLILGPNGRRFTPGGAFVWGAPKSIGVRSATIPVSFRGRHCVEARHAHARVRFKPSHRIGHPLNATAERQQ